MKCETTIDEKLKLAITMCEDMEEFDFSHMFNYIYPFTTENIAGYLPFFDFDDKSLLTVGSSGDQVLNAILCGCKKVHVRDICPFSREYYYLKMAANTVLSRKKFLDFFCYQGYPCSHQKNKSAFDKKLYMKIHEVLVDDEVRYFWDQLFERYNGLQIRDKIFSYDEKKDYAVSRMNEYLKDDIAYNKLRDNISDVQVTFSVGDIADIDKNIKYDNINLSNLATYFQSENMIKLFEHLKLLLNDGGKMLIAYLYAIERDDISYPYPDESDIYKLVYTLMNLSHGVEFHSFKGVRQLIFSDAEITDSIITYKKVKKI